MADRLRILVVEDDPDLLELMLIRLERAGHRAAGVGTGAAALQHCTGPAPPDLLLLDVGLPDLDGFELLAAVRAAARDAAPKAIFVTGRAGDEVEHRCRAMGAGYLVKPFGTETLIRAIDRGSG